MRASSRAIPSAEVVVIAYGALMSGVGLTPIGPLRLRAAARVALSNARRGFSASSQHGDRFQLALEPIDPVLPIGAQRLDANANATAGPEGVAFTAQPTDLAKLSDAEGYSSGALQRLRQEATMQRQDLATYLWSTLSAVGFDTALFRQRLFKLIRYTSPHYIPHPVRLDAEHCAITFLPPGREGTGSERLTPTRGRSHSEDLLTALEACQRKPTRTQLAYLTACLLGGLHGVCIQDLLTPLAQDPAVAQRVCAALADEQPKELARFLGMTGLDHAVYWQAFGPPNHSIRRSGLEAFLRAR